MSESIFHQLVKSADVPPTVPALTQPAAPAPTPEVTYRDFGDTKATRSAIFGKTLEAARALKPVTNARYQLHLTDVDYEDPEDYPISRQKDAILKGESLHRRMRGTWVLKDAAGAELQRKRSTVAQVPYMTPRGTFIINGTEQSLKHQMRLRAGVFARRKENGELEAHANILPGKGVSHRYTLEPQTGVFKMQLAQADLPLYPVLRHVYGLSDKELRGRWGNELWEANAKKDDPRVIDKLFAKLVRKADPNASAEDKAAAVKMALEKMEFDPEVNKRTLGEGHKNLGAATVLAAADKLLAVNRGEAEADDRDHLAYQTFHGPEDLISERLQRPGLLLHQLLWKASTKGNLDTMPVNAFNRHLHAAILDSGLGMPLEEVNPMDVFDQQTAVSRMGVGGIPSTDSIPDSARDVHPSQVGYQDLLRSPESLAAGVDTRMAFSARKGSDGRVYAPYRDPKTNETVYKSPQDVAEMTLAFPGELESGNKMVHVLASGRPRYVPREKVDLVLPKPSQWFSPVTNLVPLIPAVKGQRVAMGSRFSTQALSLKDPEAPLVRGQLPGMPGRSFSEHYGRQAGAVLAKDMPGRVESVTPDAIKVRYEDGTTDEQELYSLFPYNRKSVAGDTQIFINRNDVISSLLIKDYEWQVGDLTLSIDPSTKTSAWLAVTGYLKHKNDKKLYLVTTRSKRHVVVTEDHSLITLNSAGALTPVYPLDCVVNLTRLPVALLPHEQLEGGLRSQTDLLGNLVGLYLSEGHCPPSQPGIVSIAVKDEWRAAEVLTLLARSGYSAYRNGGAVNFTNHERCCYLTSNFGHMSYAKKIPDWVFKTPASFRRALIVGYMGGDGCLWKDRNGAIQVTGVSSSKELRDGLVAVLSSLRVFSTLFDAPRNHLNENWRDCYGFRVISRHLDRLPRWFFYADREKKFRDLLAPKYRASSFELVPIVDKAARRLLYSAFDDVPLRVYKNANQGAAAKKDLAELSGVFGQWGRSDVMWDEVAAVEPVLHEEWVYDLSVANAESFAVCQGLIVHNSYLHNTPVVAPGDPVSPGQLLAKSNYTDDKGHVALGKNLRTAYVPFAGANYEDAVVISESAAKKLTSEHMYQHSLDVDDNLRRGKKSYVSMFASRFNKRILDTIGDDGVVKPGTRVAPGDPLILAAAERPVTHRSVHAGHKPSFADRSVLWDHHGEGEVTDVAVTPKGITVAVKSMNQMQVGDKMSGVHGNKGVVAKIVPDEDMPHGQDGQPYELLANPLGVISRGNPSQKLEAWLGKIAQKTGKPFIAEDFSGVEDMTAYVEDQLKQHGMEGMEEITDPKTGRKVKVSTGVAYMMKLHHTSESKGQGRGLGAYTADGTPAKTGGVEGSSKKFALMDVNATLSHGAMSVLRDIKLVKGQKNQEYWSTYMSGFKPATPPVPLVYRKFIDQLRASGVNVERHGTKQHLMALTDKNIDDLAENREITNAETVDWRDGLKPTAGGLFDVASTGGHGGSKWSFIKLHEPMPNPVMEEPIRRLLRLTGKRFEDVVAGREKLDGRTGAEAIKAALDKVNVTQELDRCREEIRSSRKGARDEAVRRLGYLKAAETSGVHPREWVLSKVPVLPPAFRPVSQMKGGQQLISDANYLYKEVFDANKNLKDLSGKVDDVSEERETLYKAFKAVTGLGDPVQPKNQERKVRGMLAQVFGDSPKHGTVQQKLLGTTMDLVGRAVVVPNPDLSMDEVGLPENRAWEVYAPMLVRRLVRNGMNRVGALQAVKDRTGHARKALLAELDERPVLVNRAPVLHRYGLMAFYPRLTKGDVLQVSPLIVAPLGMDFDGDQQIGSVYACIDKDVAHSLEWHSTNTPHPEAFRMPFSSKMRLPALDAKDELYLFNLEDFPHVELVKESRGQYGRIEWYRVPEGVKVLSHDQEGGLRWSPVSLWSKHHGCPVELVNLKSGRQIVTDDDPRAVYGVAAGSLKLSRFCPSEALTARVLVPRLISLPATDGGGETKNYLHTAKYYSEADKLELKTELVLNEDFGYFIGCAAGDGWSSADRQFCLAGITDEIVSKIDRVITSLFNGQRPSLYSKESLVSYGVSRKHTWSSSALARLVLDQVGHRAGYKHLPVWFLRATEDFRYGLLAGIMDTDGSISVSKAKSKAKPQLMGSVSSTSIRLLQEVSLLALSLGIRGRITTTKTPAGLPFWLWSTSNYDLSRWGGRGMVHPAKLRALASVRVEKSGVLVRHDVVPVPFDLAKLICRAIPISANKTLKKPGCATIYSAFHVAKTSGYVTRDSAQKVIDHVRGGYVKHADWDVWREVVANVSITWDMVDSVDKTGVIETGYDLTVPGAETFTSADGVVLSNTSNYQVVADDEAAKEALHKMLPSRNLFNVQSLKKPTYQPRQEYVQGLWAATGGVRKDKKPRVFAKTQDVLRALANGELSPDDPVEVVDHPG